ncbi:hypothetical protein [Ileibacterium valens]|uniref:hypothetical protein n=1 Tax=Ileibacterium valens TaxID=1862668 RepID=UPI00272A97C3|nr:hypothetical protein [Ileibacterium valens]
MALTERILQAVSRLNDFSKVDEQRKNKEKQQKLAIRLDNSITQIEKFYQCLNCFKSCILNSETSNSSFNRQKFELIINNLSLTTQHLSECYKDEIIESDINNIEKEIILNSKEIQELWKKYSETVRRNLIPMLNLIKVTDNGAAAQLIQSLNSNSKAIGLPSELQMTSFKKAADKSKAYILSMDLNPEIRSLLSKMSESRATLSDLNKESLQWIQDHNLENKIKISF